MLITWKRNSLNKHILTETSLNIRIVALLFPAFNAALNVCSVEENYFRHAKNMDERHERHITHTSRKRHRNGNEALTPIWQFETSYTAIDR